jgi:hypothetical protein
VSETHARFEDDLSRPPAVRATFAEAARLVNDFRRATMLPIAIVQIPIVLVLTLANAVLYSTIFLDEPFAAGGPFAANASGAPLFAALILFAVNFLFSTVGNAAAVVASWGVVEGHPKGVAECLDPAFTRLGGLILLFVLLFGIVFLVSFTLIGIIFLPRLLFTLHAYILEGRSPAGAIVRSWQMTRGYMLRLIALVLLAVVLIIPVFVVAALNPAADESGRAYEIIADIVTTGIAGLVAIPLFAIMVSAATLFYAKIRRREAGVPVTAGS